MKVSLSLNNSYGITVNDVWLWKGEDHGKPIEDVVPFYWGYITYTRPSDILDYIFYHNNKGTLNKLLEFNHCTTMIELIEKNKEHIPAHRKHIIGKVLSTVSYSPNN